MGSAGRQLLNAELLAAWCGEARKHASLRAMRNLLKASLPFFVLSCGLNGPEPHLTCAPDAHRPSGWPATTGIQKRSLRRRWGPSAGRSSTGSLSSCSKRLAAMLLSCATLRMRCLDALI